jgi:hypothetical protein
MQLPAGTKSTDATRAAYHLAICIYTMRHIMNIIHFSVAFLRQNR